MAISDNLRGALYMNFAMFGFTTNDAFMKALTQELPLFQVIALRGTLAIFGLLLVAKLTGGLRLPTISKDRGLITLRSMADVFATILFLTALKHMPLATLSAVMQVAPLAVSLGAAMAFRDAIGWRRMTAIFIGFFGVMVIIRPGMEGFNVWSVLGLGSVLMVVVRDLSVRRMSNSVPSIMVALGGAVAVTSMGVIGSFFQGWQPISWIQAGMILCAGALLIIGYIASVTSMRVGEIGFVAPFRYSSLLWAIGFGWLLFDNLPDFYSMIGASIVVATGIYTLLRERQLRLNRDTAA